MNNFTDRSSRHPNKTLLRPSFHQPPAEFHKVIGMRYPPRISVLMSVYNQEQYIAASVRSILEQSYSHFELLIIDDGSTDRTPDILQQLARLDSRVMVWQQSNEGLTASLNKLIERAQGDMLARLDGDDIAYPNRLERQVDYLSRYPMVGVVSCWTQVVNIRDRAMFCLCCPDNHEQISALLNAGYNPIVHSSVMIRRELLVEQTIRYRLHYLQDFDLWLRLLGQTRFGAVQELLLVSRDHTQRMSARNQSVRLRVHKLIEEMHRARCQGVPEPDWQQREKAMLTDVVEDYPAYVTRALQAYQEGKTLLYLNKPTRDARSRFLRAMQYRQILPKALVFYLLSALPYHWRILLLSSASRKLNPVFAFYRPLDTIASPDELERQSRWLAQINSDTTHASY